jgi:3-phenylpropionate/cinnamic acid dioxygenase small subunit
MAATTDDRLALEDLVLRYTYAVDSGEDPELLSAMFTHDAVLEGALWRRRSGIAEITEWAKQTVAMRQDVKMRHYISNLLVDVEGDVATMRAYLVAVYRRPVMETVDAARVLYGGYEFMARRVDGAWKLTKRSVHLDVTDAGTTRDPH